jgi:hypothetical protein
VYFWFYSMKESSARALLLAIIPDIAATLLIAAGLYALLNRDFRILHTSGQRNDSRPNLRTEIASLETVIRRLSDESGLLKKRSALPALHTIFDGSETISIAVVSGLGLVNTRRALLEEQLRLGRNLRIILLDVNRKDALDSWDRLSNPPMNTPAEDIRSSARVLLGLASVRQYPGNCEIRLLDTTLPWSLIICQKQGISQMQVELHAYRRAPEERPGIFLASNTDSYWFEFFLQQFELAWSNARPATS